MTPELEIALVAIATALSPARDPWWIIGSAALALHGVPNVTVRDVDVLLSPGDATDLCRRLGLAAGPGAPDGQFRSQVFATWTAHSLPVEFMAGFACLDGAEWREVVLTSRRSFTVGEARLHAPDRAELAALLRVFGRPKDLSRVAMLEAHHQE